MSIYQGFPTTHWSLVRRGGVGEGEARHEALGVLLARYMPALRSYLRFVRRMEAGAADDLLQGFVADRLLEKELLRRADAGRGRFRTLLLTSLNHFAVSRHRAMQLREAEALGEEVSAEGASPDAVVEAAWARALIHGVVEAMREECARTGRADIWAVFEGRVLAEIFAGAAALSYEEIARRFGLASPAAAANLLVTGKRMYARLLRVAVAEYEREEGDIEAEIGELHRILARGGRTGEGE